MREIKFRAWNIATRTMIDLKKLTPLALNMDTDGLFIPFSDGLPIMQFTGLHDKNGKEIYEGDILKWVAWGSPMEEYLELHKTGKLKVEWLRGGFDIPYEDETEEVYEIIGNVYESPELLEAK